jgi:hypothetical protein
MDQLYLKITATTVFSVLSILCLLFGDVRGSRLKKVNGNVIFFFIYFMSQWYFLAIWVDFAIVDWTRDDGVFDIPVLRFMAGLTFTLTFTCLFSYKINQDIIDVIIYGLVSVLITVFMLFSVLAFDFHVRQTLLYAAVSFTVITTVHLLKDTFQERIMNPKFVRLIVFLINFYMLAYLITLTLSPLHQRLISFNAQEIIMTILDMLISFACTLLIIHYAWTLVYKPEIRLAPGDITEDMAVSIRKGHAEGDVIDWLHTYL